MEWDQIADKWAAMTDRLRGDGLVSPRKTIGPQDTGFAVNGDGRKLPDKPGAVKVGTDSSLPSNR